MRCNGGLLIMLLCFVPQSSFFRTLVLHLETNSLFFIASMANFQYSIVVTHSFPTTKPRTGRCMMCSHDSSISKCVCVMLVVFFIKISYLLTILLFLLMLVNAWMYNKANSCIFKLYFSINHLKYNKKMWMKI